MATVKINGKEVTVKSGTTVLDAAEGTGISIPHFCYHKALGPIGSCRVCLVESRGRLIQACLTPVQDGMEISTDTEAVIETRKNMIELLLLHHPLDCPVCDQGGECRLQDIEFLYGPTHGRYKGKRRVYTSQYLGPFVYQEMNRCIHCYRCARFYQDIAGGKDFGVMGMGSRVYFGRAREGRLESEFSGNLIEICPTGALLDRSSLSTSRVWDLKTAPSICPHCSLGCNTVLASRWGELLRVRNRFNPDINGFFLCDLGRFGYGFVNSGERVKRPMLKGAGGFMPISWEDAYRIAVDRIKGAHSIGALGSGRATTEANQLLKSLFGNGVIDCFSDPNEGRGVRKAIRLMRKGIGKRFSLGDVSQQADMILLIGIDPTHEAPILELKIREALTRGAKLIIIHPIEISLVKLSYRYIPYGDLPPLLSGKDLFDLIRASKSPLIISGAFDERVVEAAANLAETIEAERGEKVGLDFIFRRCNTLGAAEVIDEAGPGIKGMMDKALKGEMDLLYIMEDDPVRYYPGRCRIEDAFGKIGFLIVQDALFTDTAMLADLILPSATFAETEGNFINFEGRVQGFQRVMKPVGETRDGKEILIELANRLGINIKNSEEEGLAVSPAYNDPPPLHSTPGYPYQLIHSGTLFGSDDLSSYAPVIKEVMPEGLIIMNPEDGMKEGVKEGDRVMVISPEGRLEMGVRLSPGVKEGMVFISYGLKNPPVNRLFSEDGPGWVRVERLKP